MTEIIAMSQKELSRATILALVAEGHVSLAEAAESMGLSKRQVCMCSSFGWWGWSPTPATLAAMAAEDTASDDLPTLARIRFALFFAEDLERARSAARGPESWIPVHIRTRAAVISALSRR